jgi:hypothetical protein
MDTCGVALDDRHPYTKSDWSMWVAAMGTPQQFRAISDALYKFAHTTPQRVPFSDWYNVDDCTLKGFQARPVMGGIFAVVIMP